MSNRSEMKGVVETSSEMDLVFRSLSALTAVDVARISEDVFKYRLLPTLTDRSGGVDLTVWLDLAGHPKRQIDVIDDGGNVLFRLPPLLSSLPTTVNNNARESTSELIHMAKLKFDQHPVIGTTYLERGLSAKDVKEDPLLIERITAWNKILVRYGYEPVAPAGVVLPALPAGSESKASMFSDQDDEF